IAVGRRLHLLYICARAIQIDSESPHPPHRAIDYSNVTKDSSFHSPAGSSGTAGQRDTRTDSRADDTKAIQVNGDIVRRDLDAVGIRIRHRKVPGQTVASRHRNRDRETRSVTWGHTSGQGAILVNENDPIDRIYVAGKRG